MVAAPEAAAAAAAPSDAMEMDWVTVLYTVPLMDCTERITMRTAVYRPLQRRASTHDYRPWPHRMTMSSVSFGCACCAQPYMRSVRSGICHLQTTGFFCCACVCVFADFRSRGSCVNIACYACGNVFICVCVLHVCMVL